MKCKPTIETAPFSYTSFNRRGPKRVQKVHLEWSAKGEISFWGRVTHVLQNTGRAAPFRAGSGLLLSQWFRTWCVSNLTEAVVTAERHQLWCPKVTKSS